MLASAALATLASIAGLALVAPGRPRADGVVTRP